jgi:protein-S-isoprenylcysteine O-methyltransferase Ste14
MKQYNGNMPFLVVEEIHPTGLILIAVSAAACLLSYILRLMVHVSIYRRGKSRINFRLLLILIFLGYFGWGYWSGSDPVKMNIPSSLSIPLGGALALLGLTLFLYSEIKKHGVGTGQDLVTSGIYSRIRHPMYIGLVLLHIGFPLIFKSFAAACSTVLWAGFITVWTYFEEKNLERRFGQPYLDYKRQTWF